MSVELVRSIYRAFAVGDLDAVLASLTEDVEWRTPTSLPWSAGTYRGHPGVAEYLTAFGTALAEGRVEPEAIDGAGEVVVARGWERGRARGTGRTFEARFAHTWRVVDGRVAAMEGVADTAAIVAAFDAER